MNTLRGMYAREQRCILGSINIDRHVICIPVTVLESATRKQLLSEHALPFCRGAYTRTQTSG